MSVTVMVTGASTKTVRCGTCALAREHGEEKCWEHCKGTEEVSVAPDSNLSNGNHYQVWSLLGLEPAEWGEFKVEEVSNVLQIVNACLAREREQGLARESSESGGQRKLVTREDGMTEITTGCRVVHCASPASSWTRRLEGVRSVLSWAAQNKMGVHWG